MSVLVFLGGQKPSHGLAGEAARRAGLIIAADSGYDTCRSNGITPAIVTGDFDSIASLPHHSGIKVVPCTEQDANDFEKALRHVPEDAPILEILGGTGLRSDHFLTNLLIAANRPARQAVVFHDDTQSIHRITADCPFEGQVARGTTISLIPFSGCEGVTTSGLHWDLTGARMGPSHQLGQSNRSDSETVRIRIEGGTLYLVINHHL